MSLFRQKALDKLRSPEQLDEIMIVTSPKGWLVLLTMVALIVAALVWSTVASIEVTVQGQGALVADSADSAATTIIYVSMFDAYQIQPGMQVNVSPANVRKEEYGLLKGEVISVSNQPASYESMLQVTENESVVQMFVTNGLLAEVQVRLIPDESTPSGYAWTSAQGPPQELVDGIVSTGVVVVSDERPLGLVFANFSRIFNNES